MSGRPVRDYGDGASSRLPGCGTEIKNLVLLCALRITNTVGTYNGGSGIITSQVWREGPLTAHDAAMCCVHGHGDRGLRHRAR